MANGNPANSDNGKDCEESNPLLNNGLEENIKKPATNVADEKAVSKSQVPELGRPEFGWTADGLPLSHGSVVGESMGRTQWRSGLLSCMGRNDEFCSSDLEVCKSSFLLCDIIRKIASFTFFPFDYS